MIFNKFSVTGKKYESRSGQVYYTDRRICPTTHFTRCNDKIPIQLGQTRQDVLNRVLPLIPDNPKKAYIFGTQYAYSKKYQVDIKDVLCILGVEKRYIYFYYGVKYGVRIL